MIRYRLAVPSDSTSIAELHADSWRRAYRGMYRDEFLDGDVFDDRRTVWDQRFGEPPRNQIVSVAESAGQMVGFVCAYGADDPTWGSLIDNLHVRADAQRGGIGTALMAQAGRSLTPDYGALPVYLWVIKANLRAQRFYEAIGGRNAETADHEFHGGGHGLCCRYVWSSPHELSRAAPRGR